MPTLHVGAMWFACHAWLMDWGSVGHWVDSFVRSSGFGGLAAVVAASVAYRAATRAADQQRDTAARDRWWDQAKWAFDRLDAPATQASALEALMSCSNVLRMTQKRPSSWRPFAPVSMTT